MKVREMIIGQSYMIPDGIGGEEKGLLIEMSPLEGLNLIYGVYRVARRRKILCFHPMSPEEERDLELYRRYRFGSTPYRFPLTHKPFSTQITNGDDAYRFLWSIYAAYTREELIEICSKTQTSLAYDIYKEKCTDKTGNDIAHDLCYSYALAVNYIINF
jgi:hypothetical protein